MPLVSRRVISGSPYFVSFIAAAQYYQRYETELDQFEVINLVRRKIEEGEIFIGEPDKPSKGYYALNNNEGRYFLIQPVPKRR